MMIKIDPTELQHPERADNREGYSVESREMGTGSGKPKNLLKKKKKKKRKKECM